MTKRKTKNRVMSKIGIVIILFAWFLFGCYYLYNNTATTYDGQIVDELIEVKDNQEIVDDEIINEIHNEEIKVT